MTGAPIGYQVAEIRRRMTRPLHRQTILEAAEAAFKDSTMRNNNGVQTSKPLQTRWPIPSASNVAQWPNVNNATNVTDEQKVRLTQLLQNEASNAGK